MDTVHVFTNWAVVLWGFISLRADGIGSYHQQVTKLLPNWGPFRWYIIIWLTSGWQMHLKMDNMALRGGGGLFHQLTHSLVRLRQATPRHTRKFVYRTRTAITSHTAHWTRWLVIMVYLLPPHQGGLLPGDLAGLSFWPHGQMTRVERFTVQRN